MLTPAKSVLIVAAIASRPYVQAAVAAGFDVVALDCFADPETQQLAKQVYQVPLKNGGLDGGYVLDIVRNVDLNSVLGLCYGAGFEMQPALLSQLAQHVVLIGNAEAVVAHCKTPQYFFETCKALEISYPPIAFDQPKAAEWLKKATGGSGGTHIKLFEGGVLGTDGVYYQRYQTGKSISCLFLVGAAGVEVVGFNEQWADNQAGEPFRYGGAVSNIAISPRANTRLMSAVEKLASAIGLLGLNSCDVICDGDDVYVLEINPRLSATIGLYARDKTLLARHVAAFQHEPFAQPDTMIEQAESHAHQVLYAQQTMRLGKSVDWPVWVVDIPRAADEIKQGMPICTVLAQGETAGSAKQLVNERAGVLSQLISSKLLN